MEELGLRERKKRRTRTAIADVAMGLFDERGFDNVTVAEVAEAADVSVNTVFNYFRTKENLFFGREAEMVDQSSRAVRERAPGESAVDALRRAFVESLERRDDRSPLHPGMPNFARMIFESTALSGRFLLMMATREQNLARTLAEEAQADSDDMTPKIVAGQVSGVERALFAEINRRLVAGEAVDEARPRMIAEARRAFNLVRNGVGDYCTKPG